MFCFCVSEDNRKRLGDFEAPVLVQVTGTVEIKT